MPEYNILQTIQPLLQALENAKVPFTASAPTLHPTFFDLYAAEFSNHPDTVTGVSNIQGGRLFSSADVRNHSDLIVKGIRQNFANGLLRLQGRVVNPGVAIKDLEQNLGSAHPLWRDTAGSAFWTVPTLLCGAEDARDAMYDFLTNGIGQVMRDISPDSAAYIGEVRTISQRRFLEMKGNT
jgi:hypothetical protein